MKCNVRDRDGNSVCDGIVDLTGHCSVCGESAIDTPCNCMVCSGLADSCSEENWSPLDCTKGEKPRSCLINLTPHDISVVGANGKTLATFPPSGAIARVAVTSYPTALGDLLGVPTTHSEMGDVTGLPAERAGVYYITSQIVAGAVSGTRCDVLHPGELVRNSVGQPIGCKSLNML